MKFKELRLLIAISRVDRRIPDTSDRRRKFFSEVADEYKIINGDVVYFPYTEEQVNDIAVGYRKNSTTKIKADLAAVHSDHCFWLGRGKGPCCDDVEAGHVVPASKGHALTLANGMIECRSHNQQRSVRSIEEYLLSTDVIYLFNHHCDDCDWLYISNNEFDECEHCGASTEGETRQ